MTSSAPARLGLRALLLGLITLLGLAGCVRLDGDLTIDAEEQVSGTLTLAVQDEWYRGQGEDPAELSQTLLDDLHASPDAGITGEPYAQDGYSGATLTFTDVPVGRFEEAAGGLLSVQHSKDGSVSVTINYQSPDPDAPAWSGKLALTFPETVTKTNGTKDGTTASWTLDAKTTTLTATADAPKPFLAKVPLAVWLLLGIVAAAAVVLAMSNKRRGGNLRERIEAERTEDAGKLSDLMPAKKKRKP